MNRVRQASGSPIPFTGCWSADDPFGACHRQPDAVAKARFSKPFSAL